MRDGDFVVTDPMQEILNKKEAKQSPNTYKMHLTKKRKLTMEKTLKSKMKRPAKQASTRLDDYSEIMDQPYHNLSNTLD